MRFEPQGLHLCVGDYYFGWIFSAVEFAFDPQTLRRFGIRNQIDDSGMRQQGLATPVLRNEREQPMLDLVPLTGAGRQMAHGDGQPRLIRQALQLPLPKSDSCAVATATVCGDK